MSNVIQFLESIGRNPTMTADEYSGAVAVLAIDSAQRSALLNRDHVALNQLLDGRSKMVFAVAMPDDTQDEPSPDDADGDDVPDQDEKDTLFN